MAAFGFVCGVAVVFSWGRLGPEPGSRNPTNWLGLLAVVAPNDASKGHFLLLLVPSLVLLLASWLMLMRLSWVRRVGVRACAVIAGVWTLPFAVGPIIGSRDAYAYVAQGQLARGGLDPAKAVVSQLAPGPLLAAVDPRWRDTRPPYGGVAVAIQKVAAAAGDGRPVFALLVLRALALASVVVLVVLTARLARPGKRAIVIAALGANPLVLVHLVAGAHLDAVAAAALMGGLTLARGHPQQLRHSMGVLVCSLGAMVKLPVAAGVAYLCVCGVMAAGPTLAKRLRSLGFDLLAAATGVGLSVVLSGTGLGWVRNFGTPGRLRTGIAPADLLANAFRGIAWVFGVHPEPAHVISVTRLLLGAAAALIAAALLLPHRTPSRLHGGVPGPAWVPPPRNALAAALLLLALLGPVLYGWYLAPALPLLALAMPARPAYWLTIVLSTVLSFAAVPTLAPAWHDLQAHPAMVGAVTVAALAAAAVGAVAAKRVLSGHLKRLTGLRTKVTILTNRP